MLDSIHKDDGTFYTERLKFLRTVYQGTASAVLLVDG
jgi:hypothetical protein